MLQTDPLTIASLANERVEENFKFRTFLKGHCPLDEDELDELVQQITREVESQIDCDACRNCCYRPAVVERDELPRLARAAGMKLHLFRRNCVRQPLHDDMTLVTPCPFLREEGAARRCAAGDAKPRSCAEYPYLKKPGFVGRLFGVVQHCGECPIVFNVYERLKKHFADAFEAAEPAIDEYWEWDEGEDENDDA